MPILVNCKFDKDPINNERASVETSLMRKFVSIIYSTEVNDQIQLEFELI